MATPFHVPTSRACVIPFGFSTSLPPLGMLLYFILANLIRVECALHPGLLNLSTTDDLDWRILCVEGRAVLCIVGFSHTPDLYLLDASSSPHSIVTTKNVFRYC